MFSFFLGEYRGVGLPGHVTCMFNSVGNRQTVLQSGHFAFPPAVDESSVALHPCQLLVLSVFLIVVILDHA